MKSAGLDPYKTVKKLSLSVSKMLRAYVVGSAIALKKGCKNVYRSRWEVIVDIGLQAFCILFCSRRP